MKKLFIIPMALLLFACPSDDDVPQLTQDQVIGTWKYSAYIEDGQAQPLDPCETEETLVFSVNGNFNAMSFEENIDGNCILEYEASGTWVNIGSNNYVLTIDGGDNTEELFFEANTFYLQYIDDYGTPNDTSDDVTVRDVYTKQ